MSPSTLFERPVATRPETVREIMHRSFVTVPAHETLDEALSIMRLARLRHLPVEHNGLLVGILSYRDLQDRALARLEKSTRPESEDGRSVAVEEAMIDSPYVATPDTPLREATSRICQLRIGCLPVVERGEAGARLIGLVTESDLLRAAYSSL